MFLWHGSWVLMSKTFFLVWNLDSCSLKPARKSLWFICLSNKQQVWSSIWVFWKKQAACVYFLGSHLTVQFHLFRVTTITAVKMHRILSHELFSHGILMCVLCVYLQSYTWVLRSDGKSSIFLLWKLDNYSLKPARKTAWFIFFFITTTLVTFLSFLKETVYLPFLAGKSLTVWTHLFRVTIVMAQNTHTLPWSLLRNCAVSPNQGNNGYGSQHS